MQTDSTLIPMQTESTLMEISGFDPTKLNPQKLIAFLQSKSAFTSLHFTHQDRLLLVHVPTSHVAAVRRLSGIRYFGDKLTIRESDYAAVMQVSETSMNTQQWVTLLMPRLQGQILYLDSLRETLGVELDFNQRSTCQALATAIKSMIQNQPTIVTVSISGNRLLRLDPFLTCLCPVLPHAVNWNLSQNAFKNIQQTLQDLHRSVPLLRELQWNELPMGEGTTALAQFQKLKFVNGVAVNNANVSHSLVPKVKPSFFDGEPSQQAAVTLLNHVVSSLDHRQPLMYRDDALFSFSVAQMPPGRSAFDPFTVTEYQKLTRLIMGKYVTKTENPSPYLALNRNILKRQPQRPFIMQGRESISQFWQQFPQTRHAPLDTWQVDAYQIQTPTTPLLFVYGEGVFLQDQSGTLIGRNFSYTLLAVPSAESALGMTIVQHQMTLISSCVLRSTFPLLSLIVPTPAVSDAAVSVVMMLTGLNANWAQKAWSDNQCNIEKALRAVALLLERETLPKDAFRG